MAMTGSPCSHCGAPLNAGAKFCRACGSAVPEPVLGVTCTRCQHVNPTDSRFCRGCGTALVPAASASGAERADAASTEATQRMPAVAPGIPCAASTSVRRGPSTTVIAVTAVLMAAGGAGVALALVAGGESGHAVRHALNGLSTSTVVTESETTSNPAATSSTSTGANVTTSSTASTNTSPATSSSQGNPYTEVSAIQSVLLQSHEDIVNGNFRGAWELTSSRYRHEKEDEPGGYGTWLEHQKTLQRYLVPHGLKVSIVSWEARPEIATIRATGMRWTAPNSPCAEWQGITWMHFENGSWYYEPGYSISPQRRAQWESRLSELLGYGCA
jgi:ribosomal protein L40E